jgi:enoyl-CoA hydratase/carnithine racemase
MAVRGGIAWITLARPASRNRLDAEVMAGLVEACAEAEDAEHVRAVVLGARGPVFSAGLPPACRWPPAAWPDGVAAVAALTKPVVAALPGDAIGRGLALALACDLRLAVPRAILALPEARLGTLPGGGALVRLARLVGTGRAADLALLGTRVPAADAAGWGLVHRVVAPGRLDEAATEIARTLAARAPLALRLAKEAVVRALDLPLADGMSLEEDLYVLLQTTEDRREGTRAFLERRTPRFAGR